MPPKKNKPEIAWKQEPIRFTRRIAAVVDGQSPSLERRIATPFSALHKADVLAGWAPFDTLASLGDGEMDAIVIPGPGLDEKQALELKRAAGKLILDLDSPLVLDERGQANLGALLPLVDAVTVPTQLIATRMRPHHPRVFVLPHLLRHELWQGYSRDIVRGQRTLRVALPESCHPEVENAVRFLADKYGERVQWVRFEPLALYPDEEREFYPTVDVVVVPPPAERTQAPESLLLPAMAAQCMVVCDVNYRYVRHMHSGRIVPRANVHAWLDALNGAIVDSRTRILCGRNARTHAMRRNPDRCLGEVFLPYRLVVPESSPVSYATA